MYQLCFYVPDLHLEQVKQALFAVGAGTIGDYAECCWQTQGLGQFKPLAGSQPFIGQQQQVSTVAEWKVELVLPKQLLKPTVDALLAAHPYQTPAYHVLALVALDKV